MNIGSSSGGRLEAQRSPATQEWRWLEPRSYNRPLRNLYNDAQTSSIALVHQCRHNRTLEPPASRCAGGADVLHTGRSSPARKQATLEREYRDVRHRNLRLRSVLSLAEHAP